MGQKNHQGVSLNWNNPEGMRMLKRHLGSALGLVCEESAMCFVLWGGETIPKRAREASGFGELLVSRYFVYAGSGFCAFHVLIVATNVYKELVIYVLSTLKKKKNKSCSSCS